MHVSVGTEVPKTDDSCTFLSDGGNLGAVDDSEFWSSKSDLLGLCNLLLVSFEKMYWIYEVGREHEFVLGGLVYKPIEH